MAGNATGVPTSDEPRRSLVKVMLPNGEEIALSQLKGPRAGNVSGAMGGISLDRLGKIIEGLVAVLRPIGEIEKSGKVKVEIGIEVAVGAGKLVAVLADVSGKANVKVSIEWG